MDDRAELRASTSIGLVVGAGGPTGGPFIDSALEVLGNEVGFESAMASRIIGTSAGAFVAARVPPEPSVVATEELVETLRDLDNIDAMRPTKGTQIIRVVRVLGGRVFALLAPQEMERALYDVAPGPYHPGASAVTIEHTWGLRVEYNLAENEAEAENIVRASAAIPYKNGPIKVEGKLRADGAVHSANNVDLLDAKECPVIVVISPMVPSDGGTKASNFHRAQLYEELRPWRQADRAAVVIMPNGDEHANRLDREAFREAGATAARRALARNHDLSVD